MSEVWSRRPEMVGLGTDIGVRKKGCGHGRSDCTWLLVRSVLGMRGTAMTTERVERVEINPALMMGERIVVETDPGCASAVLSKIRWIPILHQPLFVNRPRALTG